MKNVDKASDESPYCAEDRRAVRTSAESPGHEHLVPPKLPNQMREVRFSGAFMMSFPCRHDAEFRLKMACTFSRTYLTTKVGNDTVQVGSKLMKKVLPIQLTSQQPSSDSWSKQ